jgi:hypothetical protein
MSQSLQPPIQLNSALDGVDKVLSILQYALYGFTENSLGRVRPQPTENGIEPWVQRSADDPEYYPAYPNDQLDSFSCLYAHDDEAYDENGIFGTRTVSIIVWLKLENKPYTVASKKTDMLRILRELDCVLEINGSKDQTTSGAQGIYPGFDVSGFDGRYLTYPYGGFRMEIVIHFADLCY